MLVICWNDVNEKWNGDIKCRQEKEKKMEKRRDIYNGREDLIFNRLSMAAVILAKFEMKGKREEKKKQKFNKNHKNI